MFTVGGAHQQTVHQTGKTETNNVTARREDPSSTDCPPDFRGFSSPATNRRDGNSALCIYNMTGNSAGLHIQSDRTW